MRKAHFRKVPTDTCTCRLSAVGVKLITFQYLNKFQVAFLGFFSIIGAIDEAIYMRIKKQMITAPFNDMSSTLNFGFGVGDTKITKQICQ